MSFHLSVFCLSISTLTICLPNGVVAIVVQLHQLTLSLKLDECWAPSPLRWLSHLLENSALSYGSGKERSLNLCSVNFYN